MDDQSEASRQYPRSFNVRVREATANSVDLELIGELDIAAVDAFVAVLQRFEHLRLIRLDLERLTFLDCAGLGALLGVRQRVQDRSGDVLLSNTSPIVQRILTLTGQEHVLNPGGLHPRPDNRATPR